MFDPGICFILLIIIICVIVAAVASVKAVVWLRKPVEVQLRRFMGPGMTQMKAIELTLGTLQNAVVVSSLGYMLRDGKKNTFVGTLEPGMCIAGWREDGGMSYPIDVWLDTGRRILLKSEELRKQCASLGLDAPVGMVSFAELRGLSTCYSNEVEFDPEKLEKVES